ncbi:bacitracin ABC transporter ATP-binding protein [Anaerobacillus alkalidiazotrophicus]|uniref:Bacitracin ABC transporter ATP-binding protein n=1 Tax=Anaerobacillus alkalidiazotrophicus TaxID=472963 RepID=A0A1S2M2L5_9BACI|nr:ABC transporter ATP-binding protein [Anaerobacillus alkalidiazotrophicus]OIJ18968.1 bacitracin ABC transporter ATP-binding protein [Anaerobacillus alkalidiazotrophicus]
MLTPVVSIKNVTKKIKGKKIIDDLSFDIYPGEVFGFLGPNGAGKTTTIRMLVGLISITEGEVLIKGKNVVKDFEGAISEIGAIVENPEMYKFLSGYQNLVHYARMVDGVSKERINEVVNLVGLSSRIHEKVKTYSLGMRQRLGLAQALLHSPSVLILDEPTNGLDPAGIREIRDYLRKLARVEGLSVIVSSHLLSEMELMCDRIGIIQNGKLIGVQTVNEFINGEKELVVRFEVHNTKVASQVIKENFPNYLVKDTGEFIEITLEKERIPQVNQVFVNNNVKVYSISNTAKSLEEKFLEVTGGEQNV